jgi:SAM-dependent methyltransferase
MPSQPMAPRRRLIRFVPLGAQTGAAIARLSEHVLWGGELRERLLIALLRRHYESVFRRQWIFTTELPHYYDHRIGSFAFAIGGADPYGYFRGFFAAETIRDGDTLLDIGCGDGFFARRFFAPKCTFVDAVDIDPGAIEHASNRNAASNITYYALDAVNDPFPHEQYDVVVLDGALGHLASEASGRLFEKVADRLAEDGVFVGSESLGVEGHDHLQYFESLSDLAAVLDVHFAHVQVRSMDYVIPAGASRREAFWRCANQRARLDEATWTDYGDDRAPASAVSVTRER